MAAVSVALQPLLEPRGPGNSSPVDVAILVTIVSTAVWAAATSIRLTAPYAVPVSLLVLGGAIAGLAGPLPEPALLALVQDVVILAWATSVANLARRPGVLRLLTTTWALSAVCWAGVFVTAWLLDLPVLVGRAAAQGDRALFTFGDPNYAATYWVCSVFLVYATQRPRSPALRWAGYGLLVWGLVLTASNGGVLSLLLGCTLVALAATWRRFGPVTALALLLLAGCVVGVGLRALPAVQEWARTSGEPLLVNSLGRSEHSSRQRSALVDEALDLYAVEGALGTGPGTTKELLDLRQYPYAKEAHDDYLAALVERGPVGVLGMVLLVGACCVRAGAVLRRVPRGWEEVPRAPGLVAALAAMALAATFYEVLHFRYVWLLLVFVAVIAAGRPAGRPAVEHAR